VSALARLEALRGREFVSDFRAARLGLEAVGDVSTVAPRLVGPSSVWRSHTPFAPPRHAKGGITTWEPHVEAQVCEELNRRGFPEPSSVRVLRGDWLSFRRHRISERLAASRSAVGVEIVFSEPVAGPLALGGLSHFGLGLFVPEP
ncbi:MAG: type I-U CRISPR-associated protein Cas5/Cas6, partial [Candidatus Aeolococcus gillhamiae]